MLKINDFSPSIFKFAKKNVMVKMPNSYHSKILTRMPGIAYSSVCSLHPLCGIKSQEDAIKEFDRFLNI